nr:zinc finger, CCHC-type, retrotransposon Gag domain protein [Tanacetum cinerariifolium]
MVNTRTDADLLAAVQNALQTLLPQIHAEIREEFCTSSGPSDSGGNRPPVTIHTWLKRFNKQKPRLFEKATVVVVAAAVVVISTTPVRSVTVVILTVTHVTTLLRGRLMPITTPLP